VLLYDSVEEPATGMDGSAGPATAIQEVGPSEGDPGALLTSQPVAAHLGAFFEEGIDAAVVVCGPHRVRTLIGSAGFPGLLPLVLARCVASGGQAGSGPSGSCLFGLSAFFALPEPALPKPPSVAPHDAGNYSTAMLPVLDALEGRERSEWGQCYVETFTDIHKVFAALVRFLAAVGGRGRGSGDGDDGGSGPPCHSRAAIAPQDAGAPACDTAGASQRCIHNRCLGRLPLVFRLCLLDVTRDTVAGYTPCRSLFFVDAPPAVSQGPVPAAYRQTASRLRALSCCVLHAASGGAPSNIAPIRAALGPLRLILEISDCADSLTPPAMLHQCSLDIIVEQSRRAVRDLANLLGVRERCVHERARHTDAGTTGSLECGVSTVGVPAFDASAAWRVSFALREITAAEASRQLPLARLRAEQLHKLLRASDALAEEDEGTLEQLTRCIDPGLAQQMAPQAEDTVIDGCKWGMCQVELATLSWQRQWQAQQLLGQLDVVKERDALSLQVVALEHALEEARSEDTAAVARERIRADAHEAETRVMREQLVAMRAAHASKQDEEYQRQLALRDERALAGGKRLANEARTYELECEIELRNVENLTLQGQRHESEALVERLRSELMLEKKSADALRRELQEAHQGLRGRMSEAALGSRMRESESSQQRLSREVRAAHEALGSVTSEKERALALLRKESACCAAVRRRADSLAAELGEFRSNDTSMLSRSCAPAETCPTAAEGFPTGGFAARGQASACRAFAAGSNYRDRICSGARLAATDDERSAVATVAHTRSLRGGSPGARGNSRYPSCPPRLLRDKTVAVERVRCPAGVAAAAVERKGGAVVAPAGALRTAIVVGGASPQRRPPEFVAGAAGTGGTSQLSAPTACSCSSFSSFSCATRPRSPRPMG